MRAVYEHIDKNRSGCWWRQYVLPPGSNPDYHLEEQIDRRRSLNFDQHMWDRLSELSTEAWLHDHVHPFFTIPIVHINEIDDDEDYVYIMMLYNVMFFQENRHQGFQHIGERVKNDIRSGKCHLYVCMAYEGTSGERYSSTYDDFSIMQQWCVDANLNVDNVTYITPNLLAESVGRNYGAEYNIKVCPSQEIWTWNNTRAARIYQIPDYNPSGNQIYLSYNRRPRDHRVMLLCEIQQRGLFDCGINSFNPMELNADLVKYNFNTLYGVKNYDSIVDDLIAGGEIIADVPTENITNSVGSSSHYNNTFVSIVTETLTGEDTIFFSEKSWRCLSVGHPFLLLSSPGALQMMRDMGFCTFSDYWDESYDQEINLHRRIVKIVDVIQELAGRDDLEQLARQIRPILEYNRQHFEQRVRDRFQRNLHGEIRRDTFTPMEEIILGKKVQ